MGFFCYCTSCAWVFLVFCCICFWCSPSQTSSAFLQMGQCGSHLHHSGFGAVALGVGWFGSWGSILIGGLGIVAVMVLLVGGIGQSFFSSKRLPYILPASGQGVLAWTRVFSNGGRVVLWCWSLLSFRIYWGLVICLGWLRSCLAGSGLVTTFTSYFLVGISLLLFLCCFWFFPYMGIGVRLGGLNWLDCDWGFGPNFPSSSR